MSFLEVRNEGCADTAQLAGRQLSAHACCSHPCMLTISTVWKNQVFQTDKSLLDSVLSQTQVREAQGIEGECVYARVYVGLRPHTDAGCALLGDASMPTVLQTCVCPDVTLLVCAPTYLSYHPVLSAMLKAPGASLDLKRLAALTLASISVDVAAKVSCGVVAQFTAGEPIAQLVTTGDCLWARACLLCGSLKAPSRLSLNSHITAV